MYRDSKLGIVTGYGWVWVWVDLLLPVHPFRVAGIMGMYATPTMHQLLEVQLSFPSSHLPSLESLPILDNILSVALLHQLTTYLVCVCWCCIASAALPHPLLSLPLDNPAPLLSLPHSPNAPLSVQFLPLVNLSPFHFPWLLEH